MTPREPTTRKTGRWTVEILLWCGAGLGTLSIVSAVAAVIFGIVPLVFTSGSMSPEVPTGSLGLARTVAASDLQVGDVVSVTAANETRVTHRVVATEQQSDAVVLTLEGDTNPSPDQESYRVQEADRVFFTTPYLGRFIMLLTSPWGMFLGGMAAAALLFWAFHRQPPPSAGSDSENETQQPRVEPHSKQGRRRPAQVRARKSAILLAVSVPALLVVTANSGTAAWFTDSATVNTEGFAAHRVLQPGPVTCTANTTTPNTLTVGATRLPDERYTYWARAYTPDGVGVTDYKQMTGSPAEATFNPSAFTGTLAPGTTYTFRIHSRIGAPGPTGATGWESDIFRQALFGLDQQKKLVCGKAIVPPAVVFTQPIDGFNGDKQTLQALIGPQCSGHGSTNPAVCGTAIDPNGSDVSVTYTIKRSNIGTYCWTPGGSSNGYPPGGCGVFRPVERDGDKWSIPGYIYPGVIAWNYTITIRATDTLGAITEKSIRFRVSP